MLKPIVCAASMMLICGTSFAALPTVKLNNQYRNTVNNSGVVSAPVSYDSPVMVSKTSDITTAIGKNYVGKPYVGYNNSGSATTADLRQDIANLESKITDVLDDLQNLSDKVEAVADDIPTIGLVLPNRMDDLEKRLDGVNKRMELIEQQDLPGHIDKVVGELNAQMQKIADIDRATGEVKDELDKRMSKVGTEIESLQKQTKDLQVTYLNISDTLRDDVQKKVAANAEHISELKNGLQNANLSVIDLQNNVSDIKKQMESMEKRIISLEEKMQK